MRLDMWLRNSGLIPRRTVAKTACDDGLIEVNGKRAKASLEVRIGDEVTVRIGLRVTVHRIEDLPLRPVAKSARETVAALLHSEKVEL